MKRTVRIITTVAAMALTIAIMSVGIFAATKLTIGSGTSQLSFTASGDVSATVTAVRRMGTTEETLAVPVGNEAGSATDGVFTPSFNQGAEYTGSIELGDITFTKTDDVFTLTLTVENTFANATSKVDAKYTVTCANTGDYFTIGTTSGIDSATPAAYTNGSTITIEQGKTLTLVTTIAIADAKKDTVLESGVAAQDFSFSLELTKTATPSA